MKKILLLSALLLTVMHVSAANVDLTKARATALRYLNSHESGKPLTGPSSSNLMLLHAEASTHLANAPVYYIFNTDDGFVIVSGDDRAQEILAHGDRPLDMNRMPVNMKNWLTTYKRQIEFLQAHPGLEVEKPKMRTDSFSDWIMVVLC